MKEVLFFLLDQFADWEAGPLAAALNQRGEFRVRTASLTREPIHSIGGFSIIPDYSLPLALSRDFAGLVLVGGNSWRTREAAQAAPLVRFALEKGAVVAGICDASVYLGSLGALNQAAHTSNQLEDLQSYAGVQYTNSSGYRLQQAVRDGKLVTANGTAPLEFAREVQLALGISEEEVQSWYRFFKLGYYEATACPPHSNKV